MENIRFSDKLSRKVFVFCIGTLLVAGMVGAVSTFFILLQNEKMRANQAVLGLAPSLMAMSINADYRSVWATVANLGYFYEDKLYVCFPSGLAAAHSPTTMPSEADKICRTSESWTVVPIKSRSQETVFTIVGKPKLDIMPAIWNAVVFLLTAGLLGSIAAPLLRRSVGVSLEMQVNQLVGQLKSSILFGGKSKIEFKEFRFIESEVALLTKELERIRTQEVKLSGQLQLLRVTQSAVHDLKAPLAALKTVKEKLVTGEAEKSLFDAALDRLDEVASSLVKVPFEKNESKVSLRSLLDNSLFLFRKTHPEIGRSVILNQALSGEAVATLEVASKVARIVTNLLQNAMESLSSSSRGEIGIAAEIQSHGLFVRIQDNGVGMDNISLQKALTGGWSTKETGHGLGLSSARIWIEAQSGKFEVTSQPNGGTEIQFSLLLPSEDQLL